MTGFDGAAIRPHSTRPEPLDGPLPDVFTAFDDEYFVEWQVADAGDRATQQPILFR